MGFVFLRLCVPYPMLPVSLDCSFLITPSVFSNVYCLRLVYSMLPVSLDCLFLIATSVFSNVYLHPVSCVPYNVSFTGLSIFYGPSVFSNVYLHPVSCVSYVASFTGMSIFYGTSVFSNVYQNRQIIRDVSAMVSLG